MKTIAEEIEAVAVAILEAGVSAPDVTDRAICSRLRDAKMGDDCAADVRRAMYRLEAENEQA